MVVGEGKDFVLVLGKVAVGIIKVLIAGEASSLHKAFVAETSIGHSGEAIGAQHIAVGVRQLVNDAWDTADPVSAGVGQDVAIEVVADVRFCKIIGEYPSTGIGIVVSSFQALGEIVGEAVLVPGATYAIDVDPPVRSGDVAVVLRAGTIDGAFVVESQRKKVGKVIVADYGAGGVIVDGGEPAPDVIGVVDRLQVVKIRI